MYHYYFDAPNGQICLKDLISSVRSTPCTMIEIVRRVWRYQRGNQNPSVNRRITCSTMAKKKNDKYVCHIQLL